MAYTAGSDSQKPVIGVTGNDRWFSPSWLCIAIAVWMAGGKAVRISVTKQVPAESLDGLIISGGDDIHPELFGLPAAQNQIYDTARDALEQRFIRHGLQHKLPMLGICRGHQLINVTLGGSLHTDIRSLRSLTLNRRGLMATKRVLLDADTRMARVFARTRQVWVNSLHFQAVNDVGKQLSVVARDRDGLCQAIESEDGNIFGVQWHPEYLFYVPVQKRLFRWLVERARCLIHNRGKQTL